MGFRDGCSPSSCTPRQQRVLPGRRGVASPLEPPDSGAHRHTRVGAAGGPMDDRAQAGDFSVTTRIRLTGAVSVVSTLDSVRLHQDFPSLDHLSIGRAEIIAGRSSACALHHHILPLEREDPLGPYRRSSSSTNRGSGRPTRRLVILPTHRGDPTDTSRQTPRAASRQFASRRSHVGLTWDATRA
ncbi:LLM class flavin-dependent oxidoreductase [Nonomuraea zeae]|uniref:LLM class flavin-dependent oxidoreductase n=1 Tax=Nonomuraea zeae TaxID=1642303 RepID=A0A5S4FT30_9ACTN|nr:LLM class flavin-dependent oxidoreductase [Nonomuraea zeae]